MKNINDKKKVTLTTATVEEMQKSVAVFTKLLSRFAPRESFHYALNGDTVNKVIHAKIAVEYATALVYIISAGNPIGVGMLEHLRKLQNCFVKSNNLNSYKNKNDALIRSFIRDVIGSLYYVETVKLDLAINTVSIDEDFVRLMCDFLTFRTPKWLGDIRNNKLTAIGQQFKYLDGILSKPKQNTHYELFVTDGYHSDIFIKDKRGGGKDWYSMVYGTYPVIGSGAVRMFKIGLVKGKKPIYREIVMGSEEYNTILPTIPRVTRELENTIALAEIDRTPASQEQLALLKARFATK